MAIHDDLVAPVAIHPATFFGVTDPAADPANNVLAYKLWVDTTGGPPYTLKIRNVTNTGWDDIGGSGASSGVMGPPGFAEEGEHGEIGVPGIPGVAGVAGSIAEDGWIAAGETWTFVAADAPTFTFKITGSDLTAKYTAGTRLKLTHAAAVKYFIVTKVAFAAGDTTVTVYGGTDYTLAATAITLPFFSRMKGPAGFPLDPIKWTVKVSDTTLRSQASPVSGTWYNLGSLTISVPIGAWRVGYQGQIGLDGGGAEVNPSVNITLSTGSSSETDTEFSIFAQVNGTAAAGDVYGLGSRYKFLNLAAKTSYFLNLKTGNGTATTLYLYSSVSATVIEAISAYL